QDGRGVEAHDLRGRHGDRGSRPRVACRPGCARAYLEGTKARQTHGVATLEGRGHGGQEVVYKGRRPGPGELGMGAPEIVDEVLLACHGALAKLPRPGVHRSPPAITPATAYNSRTRASRTRRRTSTSLPASSRSPG